MRAALKAFKAMSSRSPASSVTSFSPFSAFLCHVANTSSQTSPTTSSKNDWKDPAVAITLLERRAAALVREYARHVSEPDPSVYQRISKAVTEAFVAAQVGLMMQGLDKLPLRDREVVKDVYLLVGGLVLCFCSSNQLWSHP